MAERLDALGAELVPISIEEQAIKFPLGLLPFAAAETERDQAGSSELLAWVLPDTLFISPPDSFLLPADKQLGYRPVHHANIGSDFKHPPDEYWSAVLEHCQVPEDRIFPMETCTRDKILRPYINAGILVTRPENRFMGAWKDAFQSAYQNENFLPLLTDPRNALFLHQAILSGVMIHRYSQQELHPLPEAVNYPLHLQDEYPEEYKPASLDDLTTARYESIKELQAGLDSIPVGVNLRAWLADKFEVLS